MIGYLLLLFSFSSTAWWVITQYFVSGHGGENNIALYGWWGVVGWILYRAYVQWGGSKKQKLLPRWTVLVALFLSVVFAANWFLPAATFSLVFKIISYLILPLSLAVLFQAFGSRILKAVAPQWNTQDAWQIRSLFALGIGLSAFLFFWSLAGILGALSVWVLAFVMVAGVVFSYREIGEVAVWWNQPFSVHALSEGNVSDSLRLKEVTREWFFIGLMLVFSANIVGIVRSMPIGWDDLGVYMNFPKLLSQEGGILPGMGLIAWQTFTAIGFLFGSPTQAFFLSFLGGILGISALWLLISFVQEKKKAAFDFAMMSSAILYATPMIVFQQAKDMKVDMALLALGIAGTYTLVHLLVQRFFVKDGKSFSGNFWTLALIGFVLGIAFTVKVTTLLTFLVVFGVLAFAYWGWMGFIGWNFLFVGLFTFLKLWSLMFVPIPDTPTIAMIGLVCITLGLLLFSFGAWKRRAFFKEAIQAFVVLMVGIAVALLPWIGFHAWQLVSAHQPLKVSALINGYNPDAQIPKFDTIYSPKEMQERAARQTSASVKSDGKTTDEDLGRYLGYETGLNNYIKMGWNMTLQNNQRGEFTDITYVYFLLLLTSGLFLVYKRQWMAGVVVAGILGTYTVVSFVPAYFTPTPEEQKLIMQESTWFTRSPAVFEKNTQTNIYNIPLPTGEMSPDQQDQFYRQIAEMLRNGEAKNTAKWPEATWSFYLNVLAEFQKVAFQKTVTLGAIQSSSLTGTTKADMITLRQKHTSWNQKISDFFSTIELPEGYLVLVLVGVLLVWFFAATVERQGWSMFYLLNLLLLVPYTILYMISAFAIPWYGILMYALFFVFAIEGLTQMTLDDGQAINEKRRGAYHIGAVVLFVALFSHFLVGAIPHASQNLKSTGFEEFKMGLTSEFEDVLLRRAGYLEIITDLNIKDKNAFWNARMDRLKNGAPEQKMLFSLLEKNGATVGAEGLKKGIKVLVYLFMNQKFVSDPQNTIISQAAQTEFRSLARAIMYPKKEDRNTKKIYRLGTFLTYFISENLTRFWGDNLITGFDWNIYSDNRSETIDHLRKLGFEYLLVDLNAATIDRDPRHDLTRRYENLLWTTSSPDLSLVYTDNICLQVAREIPDVANNRSDFVTMAGTNYDSYSGATAGLTRGQKQYSCAAYLTKLVMQKLYSASPTLTQIVESQDLASKTEDEVLQALNEKIQTTTWMAAYKIK